MREFTWLSVILGVAIGVVMGAANAYLGSKVGMTISASIPAAVISMGILRGLLRRGTILENNMVQTVGSAGEALAAGVIFTVPALFILARDYPDAGLAPTGFWGYLTIVSYGVLGGALGVLMMIPLRRYLIVKEHDRLPYPEGTACAEVLRSGEAGATGAGLVFGGLALGAIHKLLGGVLSIWSETISIPLRTRWLDLRTAVSMEALASLLGVGFILGLRISAIMVGGGLLAWLGIIPLIAFFGAHVDAPIAPATVPIRELSPDGIWEHYIRYIGAGGVVFGGVISLLKSFPTVMASVWHALTQLVGRGGAVDERTDRDLPIWIIAGGTLLIIVTVWLMNLKQTAALPMAVAVAVCGFVFVAVASRIVGLVGSSSSPVSGMTIATLLGTALVFTMLGYSGPAAMAALIGVGAIVCIAVSIAGDGIQDLKTGYLVGATPERQQIGEMIGVVTSAFTCAAVILLLNNTYGFVEPTAEQVARWTAEGRTIHEPMEAPQANVIALVLKGILDQGMPWELVMVGMACSAVVECLGISSLPFAVGLYLPLELTTPIFAGGLLHWVTTGRGNNKRGGRAGVLASSGLVAGDALMGLLLAGFAAMELRCESWAERLADRFEWSFYADLQGWRDATPWHAWTVSAVPFAVLMLWLALVVWTHRDRGTPQGFGPPPATPAPPPPTAAEPMGTDSKGADASHGVDAGHESRYQFGGEEITESGETHSVDPDS